MSAGCARCGECCQVIKLAFSPRQIREARFRHHRHLNEHPDQWTDEARRWFADADWILTRFDYQWCDNAQSPKKSRHVYTCTAYDPDAGLCTAHEERPPVCRNYPWYGRAPTTTTLDSPQCSYWADLPAGDRPAGVRPLIPLFVLKKEGTDDQH